MNRRLVLWTVLLTTTTASPLAFAQQGQGEVTIGYQGLPYKASGESKTGIQVSDSVLMHVGAGAEGGYDTNVFYEDAASARGAAMMRTSLFADVSNATRAGVTGKLTVNARAGVTYRRYQSDDPDVQRFQNAWMPTAGVALSTGSGQLGFGIADTFVRVEEPPYNPMQVPITRYNNQASAEVRWSPGGGRLTGTARYTNMLDFIEGSFSYGTAMTNQIMLDGSWRWLPKTAVFLNATQGVVTYLESNTPKVPSYPLRLTTGLRGLISERMSVVIALGYNNGFYSSGATTGGLFGSTFIDVSATLRPTVLSRIVVGYRHGFENSLISNFYYTETAYASYVQQLASRVAIDISGRYVFKDYQGLFDPTTPARTDNFFQLGATLDYFVRNWMYAGVGYALLANDGRVTVTGPATPNVDYLKQQVFVRLGITY
jgi:hypothetical protein